MPRELTREVRSAPVATRGIPSSSSRALGRAWSRRLGSLTVAQRLVYGSACLYAVAFAVVAYERYRAYQFARLDLGDMTQAVWSTAHGHILEVTTDGGRQFVRLGAHEDVFLILLAPFWWVWSSPVMLLTFQAAAVATGVVPVFRLARKHLGSERVAAFFGFAYLLFPATQFNAFAPASGFHPVSIALPLLLYAIWYLDDDRLVAFSIVALLAASTKEEIPFAVGLLGVWYASRTGRWRIGGTILATGFAVGLFNFLVVLPHFNNGVYAFSDRYSAVGGTPGGIVRHALTDPLSLVHEVATPHKLLYVALLLVPFLGLWALEPLLMLCAVPDLAINLLSTKGDQTSVAFHYTAGIAPFVIAASIFGLARLGRQTRRLSLYVLAAVTVTAIYSPYFRGTMNISEASAANSVHRAKAGALALIPAGAPVSASNQLGGYLSERSHIALFPALADARWVVVDRDDPTYADRRGYARRIDDLAHSPAWRLVYLERGVEVFRATGDK
jgi:uncharacterized membrane protein